MGDYLKNRKIFKWENVGDQQKVLDTIRRRKKDFYLILKTKDEIEYLPLWIEHHLRYFEPDQIIIFDNMSELEETWKIYEALPEEILLLQFEGYHNEVHFIHGKFATFYQVLKESAKYFTLIDTDEFLLTAYSDRNLVKHLDELVSQYKAYGNKNFSFIAVPYIYVSKKGPVKNSADLLSGLLWGKHIVILENFNINIGMIGHNIQLKSKGLLYIPTDSFFVAHFSPNVSPKRSLRIYLSKLKKHIERIFGTDILGSLYIETVKGINKEVLEKIKSVLEDIKPYVNQVQKIDANVYRIYSTLVDTLKQIESSIEWKIKSVLEDIKPYINQVQKIDGRIYSNLVNTLKQIESSIEWKEDFNTLIHLTETEIEHFKNLYSDLKGILNLEALPLLPSWNMIEAFLSLVSHGKPYLEYGMGGSTLHAVLRGVKYVYSVDTDKKWVESIREKLEKIKNYRNIENIYLDHCDVGETGSWGYPKDNSKFNNFPLYAVLPWKRAYQTGILPDVVFIDGRFRVACFLVSAMLCKPNTTILLDDYIDRPHYHIIEKYIKPQKIVDRLAIFKVEAPLSISADLLFDLMKASVDPR